MTTISVKECFILSLASEVEVKALFARKEQDSTTEMEKEPFEARIIFLEKEQ